MYSSDESELSCDSSGSLQQQPNTRTQTNAQKQYDDGPDVYDNFDDKEPEVVTTDSDESATYVQGTGDRGYWGPVGESTLPTECIERCAVLIDCSMFDPALPQGDRNEQVVEWSIRVIQYPFQALEHELAETMLYIAEVDASYMTKLVRAQTMQRWRQLIASHHGVPCLPRGISYQFKELHRTIRTFRTYVDEFCHSLLDEKKGPSRVAKGASQQLSGSGAASEDTCMIVARTKEEVLDYLPDKFWRIIEAATKTCESEEMKRQIAFFTAERRRDEVLRALLWLQKKAKISLPPYHVFTIASSLGEEWEELVAREMTNFCCRYHSHLMINKYGNPHHCCESTVGAMAHVINAAVRQQHGG
ncbi:hypothetical protein LPMP_271120 [Leishmania panamensis]|uniref:Uncharacterized protein n=1 Tax=Leishmania panamensis TaxID=5679 RepID=A0A088RW49_LEIPA|nr:hypothetical protein LPMP_271120 [Leishmania panamensis]AIN99494.1 hypothetical protein LPMP_271120 [Leishmania panamensis]